MNDDLQSCISNIEQTTPAHQMKELQYSTQVAWEDTIEAKVALATFPPDLCNQLRELHNYSLTATRKQTRNMAKKMAKGDGKKKVTFSKGPVTVHFD